MIKVGDTIRIKENLKSELRRLDFEEYIISSFAEEWTGKTCEALAVWPEDDTQEQYVTVEMCCEVPIAACELLLNEEEQAAEFKRLFAAVCEAGIEGEREDKVRAANKLTDFMEKYKFTSAAEDTKDEVACWSI